MLVATGIELHAVTLDHGLRPEAAQEAESVATFCKARVIPHQTLRWTWDGRGNLQAAAREARYRLIADWALSRQLDAVALGHTADDVAESFLLRLRRAPGCDGLAEMPVRFERHGVRWLRPLLRHSRAGLRSHLRARGIDWSEDPSNDDMRYDRARARGLVSEMEPMGTGADAIAATARNLRAASDALDWYADREAAARATEDRGDLLLDLSGPIPAEMSRRLLNRALSWVSGHGTAPRQASLERLTAALADRQTRTLHGCRITPEGDCIRIAREFSVVAGLRSAPDALWDGRWRLHGPAAPGLEVRALGDRLAECRDWRATGLPRQSLMASPAIFRDDELVSAPLAGSPGAWQATADGRGNFAANTKDD